MIDNDIDLVNHAGDDADLEYDNEGPQQADKMSHSEGLNSIETALAYVEQISITNFLKKKLFHLQICIVEDTIFVCEVFSFDAVLYFLRD
jgi:hypothetical protein